MTNADSAPRRQPSLYISHGGGPCFWMSWPEPVGAHGFDKLKAYFSLLLASLPERPRAILMVSAHWEAALPTVSSAAAPSMLFDYHGFPEHTYSLRYPAPGSPALAARVRSLLTDAGIANADDSERGFDHGVFVPMLIIDPEARIPVVMLSLQQRLDPAEHIVIGQALAPLRDAGVLIIGSGSSYHNLQSFLRGDGRAAAAFDAWLNDAVTRSDATERNALLSNWTQAPGARASHPREEHLMPLMVCAGAARNSSGRNDFHDTISGNALSGFIFDG